MPRGVYDRNGAGKPTIKRRKRVKLVETPEMRFSRIATMRTRNVLHDMTLIENLAAARYKYSEEQATSIVSVLEAQVEKVKAALIGRAKPGVPSFTV